jgi:hypothetical protein
MPQRTLNVQITGDDRDLQRALKRSSGALDRFGKTDQPSRPRDV